MKYPENQFNKLVSTLKVLNKHIENLKEVNVHTLHFLVYQQYCTGQKHNQFVLTEHGITRRHSAEVLKLNYTELFNSDDSFELYPNNTNDNNIETAMKKALKEI